MTRISAHSSLFNIVDRKRRIEVGGAAVLIETVRLVLSAIVVALLVPPAASQCNNPPCSGSNTQVAPETCMGQVGMCLVLTCDILAGFWYLAPDTSNLTIGTSANDIRLPNYEIETVQGNNRLTILSLNQQNYGIRRIMSIEPDKMNPRSCFFSIFVHGRKLHILYYSKKRNKNTSSFLSLRIKTFQKQICQILIFKLRLYLK